MQGERAEAVQQRFNAERRFIEPLDSVCRALMALSLQAAGYHQHDRGEWRRRLSRRNQQQLTRQEKAKIDRLVEMASAGDSQAMAQLKAFDKGLPAEYVARLIRQCGNSGKRAEQLMVGFIAGEDLIEEEALHRHADALRAELGLPVSSPLERLLIDRIVTCWLHLNEAQAWCAVSEFKEVGGNAEACLQKRLSYAHRRFLQACKALACVRKLLGPNIQVNVAEQQINVMQAARPGSK